MSQIILCTGGARSGKSAMAENLAKQAGGGVLYVATAAVCDEEMKERVRRHRAARPAEWNTWEGFRNFVSFRDEDVYKNCTTVLLDCMGFMLNNIMYHTISNWDEISQAEAEKVEKAMLSELAALFDMTRQDGKNLILVTNEVGMGLVPAERSSRLYRDTLGRANQAAAAEADTVYFLVSGIPLAIKGGAQ